MIHNRLFFQMFLTAGFAAVSTALVIYVTVHFQLEKELLHKARSNLHSQMSYAQVVAKNFLISGEMPGGAAWLEEVKRSDTRLTIIDPSGVVLFDSSRNIAELDNHSQRPEIREAQTQGEGQAQRFSRSIGADLLYIAVRIDDQGKALGFVRLSSAIQLISEDLSKLQDQLIIVILLTLAVLFFISFFLSRRFYAPIAEATHFAMQIAGGNYKLRLPGLGVDEVAVLQRSLNEVAQKTEERLDRVVQSRNQVAAILSGLDEGVVALDKEDKIAHINRAAIDLLAVKTVNVGQRLWEQVDIPRLQVMLEAALDNRLDADHSLNVNGRSLEVAILPLSSELGAPDGVILVFRDVTERGQLEKIRSDFVANASHELKTPLAAIKGIVETIIDDESMPIDVNRQFLNRVLSQTNRLNKILLDLMQLSRFDRHREEGISLQQVDLVEEMSQVFLVSQANAEEQGVKLHLASTHETVFVMGEGEALSQLISNLVDNAIKYSPAESQATMSLTVENNCAVISVEDNGIGISTEEQVRVFERFYRVDTARSRELGGTGLGLSIVKHITASHDGTVELQSEVGRGSKFIVRIPLANV